ncbi:MAG: sigma-70 family RNA polymerase sigma factor [Planctomycetes bacterium]|nr:sigma-70 family RNA polymerase sigma factor [Planctomycetota bacterium]
MDAPDPDDLLREVRWLHRLARSLAADPEAAADAAGDTLVAWARTAERPRSARAWLATVLRRAAARRGRSDERRRRAEAAARARNMPAPRAPDEILASAELHRSLVDAVLALDEPYRSAIVLRYLEDLPLDDVARQLGVPGETARTRVKRGLERLRRALDRRHGDRAAWVALLPGRGPAPLVPILGAMMATKLLLGAAAAVVLAWLFLDDVRDAPAPIGPTRTAATIESPAGDRAPHDADPTGAERVERTAPIAGSATTVAAMVRGRVVDEATDLPLAGITVTTTAPHDAATARDESAADGTFALALTAAPDDDDTIVLTHPDYAPITVSIRSADRDDDARSFDCGDLALAPGTLVSGVVRNTDGAPVAGAGLFVCDTAWSSGGRRTRLREATPVGTSAADGSFVLDRRLLPNRPPPVLVAASPVGMAFVELPDLSRAAGERRIELRLAPNARVTVTAVDEEDRPIGEALVTAAPKFHPLWAMEAPLRFAHASALADALSARTDGAGRASLLLPVVAARLVVNTWFVHCEAPDRDAAGASPTIDATSRASVELRLRLPRTKPVEVRGTVRDRAGRAIAGASVTAHWRSETTARTDANGAYVLPVDRGDGDLIVVANAPDTFPGRESARPEPGVASHVVDFVLDPAVELRGRVVDQDGRPVVRANVWLADRDAAIPTDATGMFTALVSPDRPTALDVAPPDPGTAWNGPAAHLLAAGQRAVTLTLQRLRGGRASMTVRVLDESGAPLDLQLALLRRDDEGQALHHPATATIGRVTANGLALGDWSLRIVPSRGPELFTRFTVRGDAEPIDLVLQQATAITVHGDVFFEPDSLMPGELELAFGAAGQSAHFAPEAGQRTDKDRATLTLDAGAPRSFRVEDVDPSRPLVVVAGGAGLTGEGSLRSADGTAHVRVVVQRAAQVRVRSREEFQGSLLLQLRRPNGEWDEPIRYIGRSHDGELFTQDVPSGTFEWRARSPSRGTDNATAVRWQTGAFTVESGAIADIELR